MRVGILGAGISGLSCAWFLKQQGIDSVVFEATDHIGGLAHTFKWNDFDCDFSTHRLFTLDENVLHQLLALVPMGRHIRRSRIYLGGRWLHDPVNIMEILYRFSPLFTAQLAAQYLTRPRTLPPDSFNNYVLPRYGRGLNDFVFRPYTERLFGLTGDEISVEWAKQKIRLSGPLDILRESSKKKFSYFYYPVRGGYGAIGDALFKQIAPQVRFNCPVRSFETRDGRIVAVRSEQQGVAVRDEFDVVISTLPLTMTCRMLGQEFKLGYRAVQAVYLMVNTPYVSDNHWVYFMDKRSTINRLVEFKNLSPVDQPADRSVLCAEVTKECSDTVSEVIRDVVESRLLPRENIVDTLVKREPFGYPVYTRDYQQTVTQARAFLGQFGNLFLVGRSAEFEHKEVDDDFAAAGEVVRVIDQRWQPVTLKTPKEKAMPLHAENPLIYVVMLTYNNVQDTFESLKSIGQQTYQNLRVLVVDNGSKDNTPALVREKFPDVQVVETGQNLGVPWGYNIGFSLALEAGADYVFMVNNDTILAPDLIQKLLDAGQADDAIGMVMPKILYYDEPNVIWAAGGRTRAFPPAIVIVGADKDERKFSGAPEFLEFALSCGLLIHRRAFEKAGLFDPGYFYWFDDWDFSQRVRALGLKIRYVPEARMWHKVSRTIKSSGNRASFYKVWGESAARYYRRHGQPPIVTLPLHIGYIMAREVVKGNLRYIKHFVIGLIAGLTKPLGRLPSVEDIPTYVAQVQKHNA